MKTEISIKHVNSLKVGASFDDTGNLEHQLTFKCVLMPGDTDRILHLFRQRAQYGTPVELLVTSPQARMDLKVEMVKDESMDDKGGMSPFSFKEVSFSVPDDDEENYVVQFGEDGLRGIGQTPKSAVLAALVGNKVIEGDTEVNSPDVVEGVAKHLVNNYPNSPGKRKVLWALANDSFDFPPDISEPASDDKGGPGSGKKKDAGKSKTS